MHGYELLHYNDSTWIYRCLNSLIIKDMYLSFMFQLRVVRTPYMFSSFVVWGTLSRVFIKRWLRLFSLTNVGCVNGDIFNANYSILICGKKIYGRNSQPQYCNNLEKQKTENILHSKCANYYQINRHKSFNLVSRFLHKILFLEWSTFYRHLAPEFIK